MSSQVKHTHSHQDTPLSPVVANLWRMRQMRRIERSMVAHCLCAGGDKLMFIPRYI